MKINLNSKENAVESITLNLSAIEFMIFHEAIYKYSKVNKFAKELDNELNMEIANNMLNTIDELKADKTPTKDIDYSQKCGSCKWLNKEKKTCVGYVCENPTKNGEREQHT